MSHCGFSPDLSISKSKSLPRVSFFSQFDSRSVGAFRHQTMDFPKGLFASSKDSIAVSQCVIACGSRRRSRLPWKPTFKQTAALVNLGSGRTSEAAQHLVIKCSGQRRVVVVGGMADRRISHGNTKLTCHSSTSPCMEQRTYRGSEATAETKACLGDPRSTRAC